MTAGVDGRQAEVGDQTVREPVLPDHFNVATETVDDRGARARPHGDGVRLALVQVEVVAQGC